MYDTFDRKIVLVSFVEQIRFFFVGFDFRNIIIAHKHVKVTHFIFKFFLLTRFQIRQAS